MGQNEGDLGQNEGDRALRHGRPTHHLLRRLSCRGGDWLLFGLYDSDMKFLCSPDRLIHRVADADALRALVKARFPEPSPDDYEANIYALERARLLRKRTHLIHNLNALCGFGNEPPREKMHQIDDWQLLEKVTWLHKKGCTELVPLVGRPEHRFESVLKPRADVSFQVSSLIKLAPPRGGKPKLDHVGLWKVADPPLDLAMQLADGASLTDVNLLRVVSPAGQLQVRSAPD